MRIIQDELIEQKQVDENYVKCRRPHKSSDPLIANLMIKFNISQRISEA